MKNASEWEEADLLALIANAIEEHLNLDYKGSDALLNDVDPSKVPGDGKKKEIAKDVSAFANSAGGVLVYGIQEVGNVPVSLDCKLDPKITTREWLEQVINSGIKPKIDGIRINPVALDATAPGRVAYVVDIPQSDRAPHMAPDNRYYKRVNFMSVPMEDYEVRDVMNRSQSPHLEMKVEFEEKLLAISMDQNMSEPVELLLVARNLSSTPAEYAIFTLYAEDGLALRASEPGWLSLGSTRFQVGFLMVSGTGFQYNYSIPNQIPLFGDMLMAIGRVFKLRVPMDEPKDFTIAVEARTPRAQTRRFMFKLSFDGQWLRLKAD
jgi:hypothetical protein